MIAKFPSLPHYRTGREMIRSSIQFNTRGITYMTWRSIEGLRYYHHAIHLSGNYQKILQTTWRCRTWLSEVGSTTILLESVLILHTVYRRRRTLAHVSMSSRRYLDYTPPVKSIAKDAPAGTAMAGKALRDGFSGHYGSGQYTRTTSTALGKNSWTGPFRQLRDVEPAGRRCRRLS